MLSAARPVTDPGVSLRPPTLVVGFGSLASDPSFVIGPRPPWPPARFGTFGSPDLPAFRIG